MNAPRKIFVASSLDQNTINSTFEWPDGFEKTTDLDDAEFIVLDLNNIPDEWPTYPWKKRPLYIPTQNIPVLFVNLAGNIAPQFDDIKKLYKSVNLPIYRTPADLFNALQWLQSIFPFYNEKMASNLEKLEKAPAYVVLGRLREIQGGEP